MALPWKGSVLGGLYKTCLYSSLANCLPKSPVNLHAADIATSIKCSHPKASQAVSISVSWFLLGSFQLSSHRFYILPTLEVILRRGAKLQSCFQFLLLSSAFPRLLCLADIKELFLHCLCKQALGFIPPKLSQLSSIQITQTEQLQMFCLSYTALKDIF